MSDFLISLSGEYDGRHLLSLLKRPYGTYSHNGCFFNFPWGSAAVLEEHHADNRAVIKNRNGIFSWVGELVPLDGYSTLISDMQKRLKILHRSGSGLDQSDSSLKTDEIFAKLSGAFAILQADDEGLSIVTDILSFVQVYAGSDGAGKLVALGTHPDLVALICGKAPRLDLVSLGEFLDSGTTLFPDTAYANVKQLQPARCYCITFKNSTIEMKDFVYWSPPEEIHQSYHEDELASELQEAISSSVKDRCKKKGKTAVLLSGGLDSRIVLAAIPEDVDCTALTFCKSLNREASIAREVATKLKRTWVPLIMERDFLANNVENIVPLAGCEFEWVHAHTAGFTGKILEYGFNSLLNGFLFDSYLKGYFAYDIVKVKRLRGILAPRYEKRNFDYAHSVSDFCKRFLKDEILEGIYSRRQRWFEKMADGSRKSNVESVYLNIFSQNCAASFWAVDRRLLPISLIVADRRVLDFAFRCPLELKLGGRILYKVAAKICGASAYIPIANNGVRPASGYFSRLAQRFVRKSQDKLDLIIERLGRKHKTQHSWVNYQRYWLYNKKLHQIIRRYGSHLDEFNELFNNRVQQLLERKDIPWSYAFRLLQLAIWRGIVGGYRDTL